MVARLAAGARIVAARRPMPSVTQRLGA